MIYVLFVGYLPTEIVAIYTGAYHTIFSEAKVMTPQLQSLSDFVVIYNLVGNLLFEIYIYLIPTISEKLLSILKLRKKKASPI